MMKPSCRTWRQIHLESDLELPYYKPEVVQGAQETKHQTTAYSDPLQLQARACQVQKEVTATLQESTRYTMYSTWPLEVPLLLISMRGEHNKRS